MGQLIGERRLLVARVREQLRQQRDASVNDFAEIVRAVALDLSPLIADKDLDFEIATQPAPVRSHEWMLRELTRNLLHNAVRHGPEGGRLAVRVVAASGWAALTVSDDGPGISRALRESDRFWIAAVLCRSGFASGSPKGAVNKFLNKFKKIA